MSFFFFGAPIWFPVLIWAGIVTLLGVGGAVIFNTLGEAASKITIPLAIVAVPITLFVVFKIMRQINNSSKDD